MIEDIEINGRAIAFNPDVSIIIGKNGSGKTRLLRRAYDQCKHLGNVVYISLDRPSDFIPLTRCKGLTKTKDSVPQYNTINFSSGSKKDGFFSRSDISDYRLICDLDEDEKQQRLDQFAELMNGKLNIRLKRIKAHLELEGQKPFVHLSFGQRAFVWLVLHAVLLNPYKPSLIIADCPEQSGIHLALQQILIDYWLIFNDSQVILSTHAPGIFPNGWRDKIIDLREAIAF